MSDINDRIKERRKIGKLTQQKLADLLCLSKTAISQWERGLNKPSSSILTELCIVFKVSEEWLLTGREGVTEQSHKTAFMAPFFDEINVSAGYGCIPDENHSNVIPIPLCAVRYQSNLEDICCFVASGDSMEPILIDGSVVAINKSCTSIKDGKMYVIRQGDLLRVKYLIRFPHELHVQSANSAYTTEIYEKEDINDVVVVGQVFWHSSILF